MSSSDRLTKNTSNGMFAHNNIASTFTCDCGQEYDNQIALDEHKRMNCQNRGFFCQLCDEKLPTSEAMGAHLIQCGNKTIKCFSCQKYIRRGVYAYHVDNNCIDLDENYTNSSRSNRDNSSFHRQDTSSSSMGTKGTELEPLDEMNTSFKRLELNSDRKLVNTSEKQTVQPKESAISSLHGKTSQIQEDLCKDYYSIEVNHITEKLQFNIILMGSPRVGKSQLINAICNGENKAETSSSLNSCTKEVSCYFLEDNQQQMPGIKPFRVNFYDTPGIESWANQGGVTTMLKFIEDKDPICVMYCAAPGTFADLSQVRPVLKFCQEKRIFWAFVCTNMWSNVSRKEVIREFEKELAIFGDGTEKFFDQLHSRIPHKVTIFGNNALCTMVNSIEFYDPDYSPEKKPVQGIDELIHCIMDALDNDKLLGWCSAVLYRRSYWEKFSQKLTGFVSLRMKNIQNITSGSIQSIAANTMMSIFSMIRKRSV
ncbi:unnamed protein product [Rotaria sordida]|uniref:G domain-containing protein n=1 Tax=Rotaria sordida TaxID=392033 RepID=A0A814EZ02_9BILA|nr:unnamed protein product [Rotaria sordida]CAF1490610.1 unnamed protein product [Rotaria sordida]